MSVNLWRSEEHAQSYLSRADRIPHRSEGEATLLDLVPPDIRRILDLGTGDGRLLALAERICPGAAAVAIDVSGTMLAAARQRFAGDQSVTVVRHNLDQPLPSFGSFDAVISSFAIHHLVHERKRSLYAEVFDRLTAGGVFCNLEHVSSSSHRIHQNSWRSWV